VDQSGRKIEGLVTGPHKTQKPIFLVGATGTGKSAAAMELARKWGGAILCLDAMQVYRGADIGTSKPSGAERAEIPHGGLDLADFGASFDVAQYLKHAELFLREQREAGRRVLIVGGTGLYFRALTRGLCEAPQGSEELRAELASLSVAALQGRLKALDPAMLEHLDVANPRRLARAIEVVESTGKSLRAWQEETPEPLVKEFTALWIQRKRDELFERIAERVEAMFALGWEAEVRRLIEHDGVQKVKAFAGIGYREIAEAVELRRQGRSQVQPGTEGALKSNISMATRQYAKRQLTWFAREPNLQQVLLIDNQPLTTVVPALL
jgi:tRNA dimethylallyltransferase